MSGKITPAIYPLVKEVYITLSGSNANVEFSESGETINTETRLESFKKILSVLPDAVQFSEHATKKKAADELPEPDVSEFSELTVNEESLELHKKALSIQAAEKCSYFRPVTINLPQVN